MVKLAENGGPDTEVGTGPQARPLVVALLGVPYVGTTTLFNHLAGFSQRVWTWPETSVDLRTCTCRRAERIYQFTELPSVHSLIAHTPDELAAREYLLREKPDVVVVVVSATNPERSLFLLSELIGLPCRVVLAVNMADEAARRGVHIDDVALETATTAPVVKTVASKGQGISELLATVEAVASREEPVATRHLALSSHVEARVLEVEAIIRGADLSPYPERWSALKLLEGDPHLLRLAHERLAADRMQALERILADDEYSAVEVASARYDWVGSVAQASFSGQSSDVPSITERLDRVAIHPTLGPLVLAGLLALLFWLVYQVADPAVDVLNRLVAAGAAQLRGALAPYPAWISDLLANGIFGGAGAVLSLFPILIVFFLGLSLLQQSGYMARAAVVADRFMHAMGLHGLSLVPMFLGFGCNVSAVLGARVVDSERARLMTILLAPLIPCSGRMVVLVFVAGVMFGGSAPFVIWGLVALNLVVLALVGVLFDRTLLRTSRPELIMELPPYRVPNWRTAALETSQSVWEFLVRAGTIIIVVSIAIWGLASQPGGGMQNSYLAQAGRLMEPVGSLMGLDWRMMVALLVSFLARKENSLAVMGVLAASGQDGGLAAALPGMLTPAAALAYLVVQMTFVPCVSTVAAILQQTKSWRWTAFSLGYELVVSFALGLVTYRAALFLG